MTQPPTDVCSALVVEVSHLTVGNGGPVAELVAAEQAVRPGLPGTDRADAVTLLVQREPGGRWHRAERFPLAQLR